MQRELRTNFKGLDILIEYDFNPREPSTRDYPGCDPYIEISAVWVEIPEDLHSILEDELEELCWDQIREEQEAAAEAEAQDILEARGTVAEMGISWKGLK